ncbi:MAG: universal stress protein [Acidobacteria bacterium]|nr:universal stress protein [Acidobacteriota bacterium]
MLQHFVGLSVPPVLECMQIKSILCPVDFSEFSLTAFTYATCIARRLRCRLIVQHTVEVPASVYIGSSDPNSGCQALDARLTRAGIEMRRLAAVARLHVDEIRMLVNEGDIRGRLLQTIRDEHVDLVIMGGYERGLNSLAWRSLTAHVIHDSNCPVLVVSRPQRNFVTPDELQPLHLETILVATDFSRNSDCALAEALLWALKCSARIVLFHVNESGSPQRSLEREKRFQEQLARVCEQPRYNGSAYRGKSTGIVTEVKHGDARAEILQAADELGADLIVIGNSGAGKTQRPWGSTLSGIVRDGRFPVLAVPGKLARSEGSCH